MRLSEEVGSMVHAFDDPGRKAAVRDLAARVEALATENHALRVAVAAAEKAGALAENERLRLVDQAGPLRERLKRAEAEREELTKDALALERLRRDAGQLLEASQAEVEKLRAEVERLKAESDVRTGAWCKGNRDEGRGPCGACPWCYQQARVERDEARAALAVAQYGCGGPADLAAFTRLVRRLSSEVADRWEAGTIPMGEVHILILDQLAKGGR